MDTKGTLPKTLRQAVSSALTLCIHNIKGKKRSLHLLPSNSSTHNLLPHVLCLCCSSALPFLLFWSGPLISSAWWPCHHTTHSKPIPRRRRTGEEKQPVFWGLFMFCPIWPIGGERETNLKASSHSNQFVGGSFVQTPNFLIGKNTNNKG